MKKLILTGLSIFLMINLSGQTQGINYQAVIVDKTPQEIPGKDITGNIMPNHPMMVRFSILDAAGTIEYQEEHSTSTDMYGMINLVIGKGTPTLSSPGDFAAIDWNGTQKSLKVDISLSVTEVFYTDFSIEELTFIPYAFHKNITATGSLSVDGMTTLKSRVDVTEASPTFLSGNLTVNELTTLNKDLTVYAPSKLNGQVTINPDFTADGDKTDFNSYPLRVEGGKQGIAIKIKGTRSSSNYFATFWDDQNIQGRIEGQTTSELDSDPDYVFQNILLGNETFRAGVDEAKAIADVVSASTSSTVCVGLGACVTTPVPSLIVAAAAQVVLETANLALAISQEVLYNKTIRENIGVTYQSGAGDYAEWLPKSSPSDKLYAGEIVGVKGGFISRNTQNAEHLLVVSSNPIVLGNMPGPGKENDYAKVAFMGQVPVKVGGEVHPGDLILPSGNNNGAGKAISPDEISREQYKDIVGVSWSGQASGQYGYVNVAVGINTNLLARLGEKQEKKINDQQAEISDLRKQLDQMNDVLSRVIPDYASMMKKESKAETISVPMASKTVQPEPEVKTVVYHEITKEEISDALTLAEKILTEKGVDVSKHPFFTRIKSEPGYKECFINDALNRIHQEVDKNNENDMKSGARIIKVQ